MRKLVTAAATALTLAFAAATPALADHNDNGGYPYQGGGYSNGPSGNYDQYDDQYDGYRGPRDNRFREFNFDRHNGNFDSWERGWRHDRGYDGYRHQSPMSYRKLVRALRYQGYYGVRGLQRARWGFGYRAFAFDRRGMPVMLRVNPYNGRVIDVRYVGNRW
jgi:hypothetical protein